MGENLLTVQSLTHTHSNEDIFHGSDKMPKHVEMVRTKCQPKIGTDKMPTTIKSLDKMPTFGWHFVRLAFCPVGILSYHPPKDRPRDQDEEEQAKLIIEEVKCEVKVERECAEERISMLGVTFEKEQSRPGKCNMAGKSQFSRHSTGSSVTEVTGTARGNNDIEQVSCLMMLVI